MKKVMLVFGTRPEGDKNVSLVQELRKRSGIKTVVCVTGQHRQMLDQVLEIFEVIPDYDLSVMKEKQTLFDVTAGILLKIRETLEECKPDLVLVHGILPQHLRRRCMFLSEIPVGHVEAGLRTGNIYSPFPEEFNRQAVSLVSRYHLLRQKQPRKSASGGKSGKHDFCTRKYCDRCVKDDGEEKLSAPGSGLGVRQPSDSRYRRTGVENLGEPMKHMFRAIRRVCREHEDIKVIYPVHMNPAVRKIADKILGKEEKIRMIEPLDVLDFHNLWHEVI